MLFHTPTPSATRLASLWRQLAIDMREFEDKSLQHHPPQLHLSPATITRDIQTLHSHVTVTLTLLRASALFYAADQSAHRAYMHSLRCRHEGAYLDPVPVSPYLHLSDADFFAVVNFAWEPQAPTQASQPRLVTVVNTNKAAT